MLFTQTDAASLISRHQWRPLIDGTVPHSDNHSMLSLFICRSLVNLNLLLRVPVLLFDHDHSSHCPFFHFLSEVCFLFLVCSAFTSLADGSVLVWLHRLSGKVAFTESPWTGWMWWDFACRMKWDCFYEISHEDEFPSVFVLASVRHWRLNRYQCLPTEYVYIYIYIEFSISLSFPTTS